MSSAAEEMAKTRDEEDLGGEPSAKRDSGSFLLRVWREPTSPNGTEGVVRCYMKNLKTGEECYMTSAGALASQLLAELERKPTRSSGTAGTDESCRREG